MRTYNETLEGHQREIQMAQARLRKMRENRVNAKFQELTQKDEQTRINRYSEGYCYGCARVDTVLSSLWFACTDCSARRGREGLMAVVCRKYGEEFCDFCARWRLEVRQINISMCHKCIGRVTQAHQKYHEMGGRESHPFHKKMQRKYGNDYQRVLGEGVRWNRGV